MTLLFWMGVAWLGYVYVGYPLILAVLALVHRVRPVTRDDFLPTVSVLIAAHNEERDIGWKVSETLRWDYPSERLEVLVASDASEDRTDEIVRAIKDPQLRFVRMETRRGKGAALNRLAELAQGELLLFTDAHTHIGAGCLRRVVRHFADGRVGCVTGDTHSWRQDSAVLRKGAQVYLDYETIIRHLESEIGSVLTCDGGIFCMRRSLFEPLCPELANDLELPLRVGRAGYWVRHEPEARACEKESPSLWESFRQRRRISAQGMLAMWKLRGLLDCLSGWQFVSRKLLRWLTLVPIALVTVSAFMLSGRPVFAAILMLQTVFYGSALAGLNLALSSRRAGPLVCAPFYVLLASLSALVGVVDVCLGRRYAVWESPALARGQDQETWQSVH